MHKSSNIWSVNTIKNLTDKSLPLGTLNCSNVNFWFLYYINISNLLICNYPYYITLPLQLKINNFLLDIIYEWINIKVLHFIRFEFNGINEVIKISFP